VTLTAGNDIANIGGSIDAADSLKLAAGRDLNVVSSTRTSQSTQGSRTNIDGVASLSVTGSGATLIASAGHDINLNAAQVTNSGKLGKTSIEALNDVNLGTVAESSSQAIKWDADNHRDESAIADVGSMIAAVGDVNLKAGHDLNTRAAEVTSDPGAIVAVTGNDINLQAGSSSVNVDESHKSAGSSGWFATKTLETRDRVAQTQAQESTFSGHTVALQSGADINVTGSDIVSTMDTTLSAGRDINIAAAVDTIDETHQRNEETSGMFSGGGMGFTIGTKEKNNTDQRIRANASASSIGSTKGSIGISAGNHYRQTGSQLLTPKGNIDIAAKRVDVAAAIETEQNNRKSVSKQSGLSISITNPIIAAVQTVRQMKAASKKTKDQRMQGLASAAAALTIANTQDMVAASAAPAGGIDLAVSIGGSKSINRNKQNSTSAHGSRIAAGGDITIAATGAGKDSDLMVQGSDIAAGKNIVLRADDEVNLLAAENTNEQHSSNKGGSASIGFSVGTSGYMVNLGLSGNIGRGDGGDLIHINTHVDAAKNLTINSGADTNIVGAVASGKQVTVEVGSAGKGNLNIVSLQDSSKYKSSQQSLGGSVSVGMGKMSGNISAAQSKVDGKYRSVNEQSGITAGDGGFDIKVNGNTHLEGGKIASTDKAAGHVKGKGKGKNKNKGKGTANKNSLVTETLTQSDIDNFSEHKASSLSLSIGGGYGSAGSAMNGTGIGHGNSGGKESGVTKAGISSATIKITDGEAQKAKTGSSAKETIASISSDVSTDRDTSGKLTKGWDGEQLQEEVTAQAEITAVFGKESSKGIGTYATNQENDLRRQAKEAKKSDPALARKLNAEADKWGEGGDYRSALHTAAGGLVGGWGGAAGAMASTQTMPQLSTMIDEMELPSAVKQALAQVTAGALGAAIGGVVDLAGALNVEANNHQLHESEKVLAERLADESNGQYTQKEIEEQMRGMTVREGRVNGDGPVTGGNNSETVIGKLPSSTDDTWLFAGKTPDGEVVYTQQAAVPDTDIRAYIVRKTTRDSLPSLVTYEGPFIAPKKPVYTNVSLRIPTAKCAVTAADCAAGIESSLGSAERRARGVENLNTVSRWAGQVSSAANAYASYLAYRPTVVTQAAAATQIGVAGAADILGMSSDLLAQFLQPDARQYFDDGIIDIVNYRISKKFPVFGPAINETVELVRNINNPSS
jgi:filamentous hemagglutinin